MPRTELQIPDEASAEMDHLELTVEGPNGSVTRRLWYPDVSVSADGDSVVIESDEDDAKTMSTLGTFESHVRNMFHGVTEGWEYEMEVFYSHFPMQVDVEGEEVVIENFLGERAPRRTEIHGDTDVSVSEEQITLSGPDVEAVGQTAADIEQLTRVTDKDVRIFQDGVYITQKPTRGDA
ncbi:50S ribosomal protein L6 [Halosimplex litoreum]|uniref:Large ribosomal subunit protein uL6 n=1 Tax=Halosimplex litoreum TaxID=1198301 RepID=A0A7T3KVR0_9EURY|nr:50S ribosomal protein L6 [Halosimplex litoreum]QPV63253.1 50S ribosomal protein L6 [Halosimplex litoreum]